MTVPYTQEELAELQRKLKTELGRLLNSLRKNTGNAGRKKVLRPCPRCGAQFGARELREHHCAA